MSRMARRWYVQAHLHLFSMEPPYSSVRLLMPSFVNWSIRYPLAAWIWPECQATKASLLQKDIINSCCNCWAIVASEDHQLFLIFGIWCMCSSDRQRSDSNYPEQVVIKSQIMQHIGKATTRHPSYLNTVETSIDGITCWLSECLDLVLDALAVQRDWNCGAIRIASCQRPCKSPKLGAKAWGRSLCSP